MSDINFVDLLDTPVPADSACAFRRSDFGNAERLVAEHGRDLRYAPGIGWFAWDGRRWKRDDDGEVTRRMKRTVRSIYAAAADIDDDDERRKLNAWAIASESEARLRAAVSLAETEKAVIVRPDELDADPWLLNAANGTVDLRTGALREHQRDDLLTKMTTVAFNHEATDPRLDSFLERVTGGDQELALFLRRAAGYSLTGHTSEEVLFFPHGPTATGKSSFLDALRAALGEYSSVADFETFLKRRGDSGVRNDIARLAGSRLVISIEVDEGKALAEGLIKQLTGGDVVAARFLYRESFEFRPVFKLWLAANERPRVSADDSAIWRRIIQIPFVQEIPAGERDERVKLELRTDPDVQAAVLTWAVRGCIDWRANGLSVPQQVRDYTNEYRAENDPLADWLGDCCQLDAEAWTASDVLKRSYAAWCETNGEKPLHPNTLAAHLKAKNCRVERRHSGRGWCGIRTLNESVTP